MSTIRRYYWDSSVFVSFLNEEENRHGIVESLLKEAHAGRAEIVTSTFTLVEVLKLRGHSPINEKDEAELQTFFEYPFIKFVEPDRDVCERARVFVWRHGMKSKDAVHMACAERAAKTVFINELFSWDDDFIRINGKTHVSFGISKPYLNQLLLNLIDNDSSKETETGDEEDETASPLTTESDAGRSPEKGDEYKPGKAEEGK